MQNLPNFRSHSNGSILCVDIIGYFLCLWLHCKLFILRIKDIIYLDYIRLILFQHSNEEAIFSFFKCPISISREHYGFKDSYADSVWILSSRIVRYADRVNDSKSIGTIQRRRRSSSTDSTGLIFLLSKLHYL